MGLFNGTLYDLTALTGAHIDAVNEMGMIGGWMTDGKSYLRYLDGRTLNPPGFSVVAIGPGGHFASTRDLGPYSVEGFYGSPDGSIVSFAKDTGRFGIEAPPPNAIVMHWASIVVSDINAAGDVVGRLSGTPFIYRAGRLSSLSLAVADSGFIVLDANAINDAGQIAGVVFNESQRLRAVVLTPAAPPPPGGLGFSVHNRVVTLGWQPAAGATDYILEAGSVPGARDLYFAAIGNQTSFFTAAPPGRYYVRVCARNVSGVSEPSNEVVVDVP